MRTKIQAVALQQQQKRVVQVEHVHTHAYKRVRARTKPSPTLLLRHADVNLERCYRDVPYTHVHSAHCAQSGLIQLTFLKPFSPHAQAL